MKKYVLLAVALAPAAAMAGVTADVAVVSDYRYNGVSNTEKKPALQLGLNYSHDSGVYLGAWTSNVDFGGTDKTNLEFDITGGYAGNLNPELGFDIGYAQYTYHGASYSGDYDYGELYLGLTFSEDTSLYWYHAQKYVGTSTHHDIISLSHTLSIGDYSVTLSAAHNQSGDKAVYAWDADKAAYQNWQVDVSREVQGFEVTASVMGTTISKSFNKNADTTVVLSVKRSFELM